MSAVLVYSPENLRFHMPYRGKSIAVPVIIRGGLLYTVFGER